VTADARGLIELRRPRPWRKRNREQSHRPQRPQSTTDPLDHKGRSNEYDCIDPRKPNTDNHHRRDKTPMGNDESQSVTDILPESIQRCIRRDQPATFRLLRITPDTARQTSPAIKYHTQAPNQRRSKLGSGSP